MSQATNETSKDEEKRINISNLPTEVLLRILAYACDENLYSDEHELEFDDLSILNLISTCQMWKHIIVTDERLFNASRRRARYLSTRHLGLCLIFILLLRQPD